jgi:hypothetical protein
MRFLPFLVAVIVSASLQAEQKKGVHSEAGTKLKGEFRFDPSFLAQEADPPGNDVLVLEKITVSRSSTMWNQFERTMIQEHQARLKEEKFTWKYGGPFASKDFGKVRAQIGIWGKGGGYDFLKIRW